jgi:hypothetical protein
MAIELPEVKTMHKMPLILLIGIFISDRAQCIENQCIRCHSKIEKSDVFHPAHSFGEWQESVHSKKGASCGACHGGNPSARDAAAAHKGIERSSDPGSRIYFNRIPVTCGTCHVRELESFKRSSHYKELQRSGKGPNCVTCHGSMATRILSPMDMESVCNLCHIRPTKAYAALISLQTTQKLMEQLRKKIQDSRSNQTDVSAQSSDLKKAEQMYKDALFAWHSFDMENVLPAVQGLNREIRNSLHELDLKEKSKMKTEGPAK